MLRTLFNQSPREDQGIYKECLDHIEAFCTEVRKRSHQQSLFSKYYRLDLTAQAFTRALDELEQSVYCSREFARGLIDQTEESMDRQERLSYHRHLYFYKNAFIRIFSILDKLGYFMNELFGVKTEKVKPKFSYFTVLRQMSRVNLEPELGGKLNEYKGEYKDALNRLRKKRNVEIHFINVEMLDDLTLQQKEYLEHQHIENLEANVRDLEKGYEMVCRSIRTIFEYAKKHLH